MTARHHHALRTPDIVGGSYRDVGEHSLALEQVIFVAVAKVTRHRRIQSDAVLPLFVNQALTSRKAIFWPSKAALGPQSARASASRAGRDSQNGASCVRKVCTNRLLRSFDLCR